MGISPKVASSTRDPYAPAMGKNSGQPPRARELQLYRYELPGGWTVLAGKSNVDNDRLSLKVAAPNDWWFHVRGMPGSHVVLQLGELGEPDRDAIKAAAAIAAHHSKARTAGTVPVSMTRARFVTKERGSSPGTVTIRKEAVVKVRPGLP
jgi:predicted ribosome quality control (RQC) complex YloA/Tae2 family protein